MWALGGISHTGGSGFLVKSHGLTIVPWFHYSVKTVSVSQCRQ